MLKGEKHAAEERDMAEILEGMCGEHDSSLISISHG